MVETSDKDLVMNNFNIFRALVFQNIIFPELRKKKKALLKNELEISTLVECLNDDNLFLLAQKRFGYKVADPKELKKKGISKLLPTKDKPYLSFSRMHSRTLRLKNTLTK